MTQMFYKTHLIEEYMLMTVFMCNVFSVQLTIPQLITFFVTIILIAIATPSVPGADVIAISALFSSVGLPKEAISIGITLDIFAAMIVTGFRSGSLPMVFSILDKEMKED